MFKKVRPLSLTEIRYFFNITHREDLRAEEGVALVNQQCNQENVIGS